MTDRHHLASLDVVRGMSVAAMILVNNPGDWNTVFAPLLHSDWNGWTFADAVFPFFVFVMGCAMPFAFARRDAMHGGQWRSSRRILRRAALLVVLGLVVNAVAAGPHPAATRIPGVLIAIDTIARSPIPPLAVHLPRRIAKHPIQIKEIHTSRRYESQHYPRYRSPTPPGIRQCIYPVLPTGQSGFRRLRIEYVEQAM